MRSFDPTAKHALPRFHAQLLLALNGCHFSYESLYWKVRKSLQKVETNKNSVLEYRTCFCTAEFASCPALFATTPNSSSPDTKLATETSSTTRSTSSSTSSPSSERSSSSYQRKKTKKSENADEIKSFLLQLTIFEIIDSYNGNSTIHLFQRSSVFRKQ